MAQIRHTSTARVMVLVYTSRHMKQVLRKRIPLPSRTHSASEECKRAKHIFLRKFSIVNNSGFREASYLYTDQEFFSFIEHILLTGLPKRPWNLHDKIHLYTPSFVRMSPYLEQFSIPLEELSISTYVS